MKTVALREAKQSLSGFVAHAQRERVLITKHGKPAALVIGVEGQDIEDVLLSQDPEFWKLVEARRQQPTLSIADVRARLGVAPKSARRPRQRKTTARKPSRR
jgi:prevent-host-death family protein